MKNIIFLISQPRAGSTATQLQLARHPMIATTSEPWLLLPLLGLHKSGFLKGIYNHHLFNITQKEYIKNLGENVFNESIRKLVYHQYQSLSGDKVWFLDKTPRYYEILPELYHVFPDAKFIVLKRNPLDVLKSIIYTWCMDDDNKILGYSRDIVKAPFLIQNFVNSNRDKENILELRYEDFTSNPERKLVEMLDFLSLESAKLRDFVPSSILNGTFGDQSNARTSSDIFKNDVSWSELEKIKKRKYRILAKNYYRFLGDEFLKEYGSYNVSSQPKSYLSYESRILSKIIKRAEE